MLLLQKLAAAEKLSLPEVFKLLMSSHYKFISARSKCDCYLSAACRAQSLRRGNKDAVHSDLKIIEGFLLCDLCSGWETTPCTSPRSAGLERGSEICLYIRLR